MRNPDAKKSRINVDARIEQVRRLTLLGLTRSEIARELGIHEGTVSRIRRRAGVQLPAHPPYPEEVYERAAVLLADGASCAEVARTLGVGDWAIRNRFPDAAWTHAQRVEWLRALGEHDPEYAWLRNAKGGVWGQPRHLRSA